MPFLFLGADARQRRYQLLGVVVLRILKQRVGVVHLDRLAIIHHQHTVAHETYHAEVVGDEDIGEVSFFFQAVQQVQNLCLHADV